MRKKVLCSVFLCFVMTLLVGVTAFACPEEETAQDNLGITESLSGNSLSEEINTHNPENAESVEDGADKTLSEEGKEELSTEPGKQEEQGNPETEAGAGDAPGDSSSVLLQPDNDEEMPENPDGDSNNPDAEENKNPDDALPERDYSGQEYCSALALQGAVPAGSDGNGAQQPESLGESAYDIVSFSFEVVQNQDYTNKDKTNCVLNFSFIDNITNISYNGCITGIRVKSSDCAAIIEDVKKDTSVYRNDLFDIIDSAAKYFLSEHASKDEYYGVNNFSTTWYDFIDAEKYCGTIQGYEVNQGPWGDGYLCWAGAASNMLSYAGWSGNFTEDEVFTSFANAFFDSGLHNLNGVLWYLNGINPSENQTDENGDIRLLDTLVDENKPASERNVYTGDSIRNQIEYSANLLCRDVGISNLDDFSDILVDAVNKGDSIGLANTANDPKYLGGHAQTVFGYIRQSDLTGSSALKALFISDSDTNFADPSPESVAKKNAKDSEAARSKCVNLYMMYYTEKLINHWGQPTFELYTALSGETPKDQKLITSITVLTNIKSAEAFPKDTGTRDSRNTVDIIPLMVEECTDELDCVRVQFKNQSYKAMTYREDAEITLCYNLLVYDSGKQFVCSIPGKGPGYLRAMESIFYVTPTTSLASGTYYLLAELSSIGYYDNDGQFVPIEEAFYQNNTLIWEKALLITIPPKPDPASPAVYKTIPVFSANYLLASDSELEIIFSRPSGMKNFIRLLDSNGEEVSEEHYTITENSDGTFTIEFTPEFLHTLRFGYNSLTLVGDGGTVLFGITVM